MYPIVKQIHLSLLKNHHTLSVAESCTGGLLSRLLTELPGSSNYFILGVVTYSNKAKERILKVPHRVLSAKGAVSSPVARLMAQNVRKISGSDFGVAITGIAGPTGGTARKPVGTVFIAASSTRKTICKKFPFKGTRQEIRKQSALKSLLLLKSIT